MLPDLGPAMTTAEDPNRPQFLITGVIGGWDPSTRRLERTKPDSRKGIRSR